MKTRLLFTLLLSCFLIAAYAQQQSSWEKWEWLMGSWTGEGGGDTGQGGGTFSFQTDLDQYILIRKSHSEYMGNNQQQVLHDDLMIIYPNESGSPQKAIYFDNEGHIINYNISYQEQSIVLTSEAAPKTPIFRLTYTPVDEQMVDTKFEMSFDGKNFKNYLQGKSKKTE